MYGRRGYYPRKNSITFGGAFTFSSTPIILLIVLGALMGLMILLGSIFIWPYLFETTGSEGAMLSKGKLFVFLDIDVGLSIVVSLFYQLLEFSGEGKRLLRIVRDSLMISAAVSIAANIVLWLCLGNSRLPLDGFCAKGLGVLLDMSICVLMGILPSVASSIVVGPLLILISGIRELWKNRY